MLLWVLNIISHKRTAGFTDTNYEIAKQHIKIYSSYKNHGTFGISNKKVYCTNRPYAP